MTRQNPGRWLPSRPCLAVAFSLAACPPAAGQDLTRAEAMADFRFLLQTLEQTHPDPYGAYGGKIGFKLMAHQFGHALPEEGITRPEFAARLEAFLAVLGDGHTRLAPPPLPVGSPSQRQLPVRLGVTADHVFVSAVADGFEDLLGGRLTDVNGIAFSEWLERGRRASPVENPIGAMRTLAGWLPSAARATRLGIGGDGTATLTLVRPDSSTVTRRLSYDSTWTVHQPPLIPDSWHLRQEGPFAWGIIQPSGIGFLRVSTIVGREALLEVRGRTDFADLVRNYHARFPGNARGSPDIGGIPCLTTVLRSLLDEMRTSGSRQLLVDVRANDGGWSSQMIPFYLLLFGDRYLATDFPDRWVDVASPQLLAINGWDEDSLRAHWGDEYTIGDYRVQESGPLGVGVEERRRFRRRLQAMGCGLEELAESLGGAPYLDVPVTVLLDSGTFSAAFQFVYFASHLGARTTGVPSAQAPNAFTNAVRITLPHSGLTGSVARSAQIFAPDDPGGGRLHPLDRPLRWEDLARGRFARNGDLLSALRFVTGEEGETTGP